MDEAEGRELLTALLDAWRRRPYAELAALVDGEPATGELQGPRECVYGYEVQVFWDSHAGGDLRVIGSIDDGGLRALLPLTDGFILTPEGTFVGEEES